MENSVKNNNMSNQPVFWKMRDGKLISVDEMDINHLRNVLKMIIRNSTNAKPKVEFKLNGDMAQSFNDDMELWEIEAEYNAEDYGCK